MPNNAEFTAMERSRFAAADANQLLLGWRRDLAILIIGLLLGQASIMVSSL